ncbi:hypothetical protein KC319_g15801, partial [Hortaea werneckii]
SGRSHGAAQQRTWTNAAGSSGSAPRAAAAGPSFPALPSANGSSSRAQPSGWLALRPAGSTPSSSRASPAPSRTQSSTNVPKGRDAFPALPAAKKPTSTVFSPGYTGAGVIRSNASPAVGNAWGASSASSSAAPTPPAEDGIVETGKGKGKKGKKQLVFQWG